MVPGVAEPGPLDPRLPEVLQAGAVLPGGRVDPHGRGDRGRVQERAASLRRADVVRDGGEDPLQRRHGHQEPSRELQLPTA